MKQYIFWIVWTIMLTGHSCTNSSEHLNPEIHFSRDTGWTGEPAGFVYYKGMYHLFYLCNPLDIILGNIGWGHAVSRDLLHWEDMPLAIPADEDGQIYPGSVIVDVCNTSGFGSADASVFIAYYTRYKPADSEKGISSSCHPEMAYSKDEGQTWTRKTSLHFAGNDKPALRNPHVSWNPVLDKWIMTISTGTSIRFYTSDDTLNWDYLDEFGEDVETIGGWENSSLYPLQVGDSNETKWVLMVSMNGGPSDDAPGTRYFIGDLDESGFQVVQSKMQWLDYGKDNYGGIVCNNLSDNRTIMISWMNSWYYAYFTPTGSRRGSMTLPRQLSLAKEKECYLLSSSFVDEVNDRCTTPLVTGKVELTGSRELVGKPDASVPTFLLHLTFDNSDRYAMWAAREYGVRLKTGSGKALTIAYKAEMGYYYVDRSELDGNNFSADYRKPLAASYILEAPLDKWQIIVDNESVELIAGNRQVSITSLVFIKEKFESIEVFSEKGKKVLLESRFIKPGQRKTE